MTQPTLYPPLATLELPECSGSVSEILLNDISPELTEALELTVMHAATGQVVEGLLEPELCAAGLQLTLLSDHRQLPAGEWRLQAAAQLTQRIRVRQIPDYQGQQSLEIVTPQAIYLYHLQGAGFASIIDGDGNDWLSYRPYGGSDGRYRGIPNLVYPEGHFHPGGTSCSTRILRQTPVKLTLLSESTDGQWQCAWEILPSFARLTVLKAPKPYWFLYEGTPAGRLDETAGFCVRSSTQRSPLSECWDETLPAPRWLYFGSAGSAQVLYLIHHEAAEGLDSYWPMEHNMTVFGFGRKDLQSYLTRAPAQFTVGLCVHTQLEQVLTERLRAPLTARWQPPSKEV